MTNEKIVKALRHCEETRCASCPLRERGNCINKLAKAAADAIEKLTAENVILPDGQASAIETLRKEIEWKDMVIALAQRKQAQAEAERDAALADLADARSCKTCKYACDTRDCSSCKSKTCKCRECHLDKNAWEWRGAPEAPEEGDKHE